MNSGARQRGPLDRNGLAALSDLKTEAWNGVFRSLEREQSDFLARQPGFRRPESTWPVDPLHTWSRVWEYPYVYHHLKRWRSGRAASAMPKVADVGSQVTFFPFAVARLGFHVLCTDIDPACETALEQAIKHVPHDPGSVAFRLASETTLPLEDEECDAVYCISTLEHIPRFEGTVREMARVLRSGGLLLLTIDLDLQGNAAIGPARYTELRDVLRESFRDATPEYLAQLIEAYNYYFYHYEETPLLVVDTNEIDFVNRPADFDDLVAQVQKVKKGVQYYVPAANT